MRRPAIITKYFKSSPKVANHNQRRQHTLALEEEWLTQDCWFRLHTTLHGKQVTDCWKLLKYHVHSGHRYSELKLLDFADLLARQMVNNSCSESPPTCSTTK